MRLKACCLMMFWACSSSIPAQEVVNNDLDVIGIMEVGPDATTTRFLGTDLLRLTGERVRLKFIDTSVTGTARDWRIRINNGGGNINGFFIDDMGSNNEDGAENGQVATPFRIQAGAKENSFVLSDIGKPGNNGSRIGLGTDSPAASLHIRNAATPAIRLERTGEINAPRAWAIGGGSDFFVRDVPAATTPFRLQSGAAPTSLVISKPRILTGGPQIGIGTDDARANLHIMDTDNPSVRLEDESRAWTITNASSSGRLLFGSSRPGSARLVLSFSPSVSNVITSNDNGDVGFGTSAPEADFHIKRGTTFSRVNAGSTTFTASSSRTLKENIQEYEQADLLERMCEVPIVTYDWKPEHFEGEEKDRKNRIGLVAEDFHSILGRGSETEIDGQELQSVLWLAVQQLYKENKRLREANEDMKEQMDLQSEDIRTIAARLDELVEASLR